MLIAPSGRQHRARVHGLRIRTRDAWAVRLGRAWRCAVPAERCTAHRHVRATGERHVSARRCNTAAVSDLDDIQQRLDDVITSLLPPLRASKTLVPTAVEQLMGIGRDLASTIPQESVVPRRLVGDTWFVFTAMLAEADHAKDPGPIMRVAWEWQEWLAEPSVPHSDRNVRPLIGMSVRRRPLPITRGAGQM